MTDKAIQENRNATRPSWERIRADLIEYMNDPQKADEGTGEDRPYIGRAFDVDYLPPLHEYILSADTVAPHTFCDCTESDLEAAEELEEAPTCDELKGYGRIQFSYGGPTEEIRYHSADRIEFWRLDWFVGASVRIDSEDVAQWVCQWFGVNLGLEALAEFA